MSSYHFSPKRYFPQCWCIYLLYLHTHPQNEVFTQFRCFFFYIRVISRSCFLYYNMLIWVYLIPILLAFFQFHVRKNQQRLLCIILSVAWSRYTAMTIFSHVSSIYFPFKIVAPFYEYNFPWFFSTLYFIRISSWFAFSSLLILVGWYRKISRQKVYAKKYSDFWNGKITRIFLTEKNFSFWHSNV